MEAKKPHEKPGRKPNFCQAEIIVMLEEIQASKEMIMSHFQNSITHRMKGRSVAKSHPELRTYVWLPCVP